MADPGGPKQENVLELGSLNQVPRGRARHRRRRESEDWSSMFSFMDALCGYQWAGLLHYSMRRRGRAGI